MTQVVKTGLYLCPDSADECIVGIFCWTFLILFATMKVMFGVVVVIVLLCEALDYVFGGGYQ